MPSIQELVENARVDRANPDWRTRLTKPPAANFEPGQTWRARMTTNKGEVVIRLLPETAPMHVTSFAYLVGLGFYDGLSFHRVIPGFMAQGGCPRGEGTGGPGYKYDGEYDPKVKHDRPGVLSAANAGPGTDGSQFFLTFVPTPWLDGKHTIYGFVESGDATLKALEQAGTQGGRPKEPLKIETVKIEVTP